MILDTLDHAPRYVSLHPGFAAAFAFLARPDLREMALDRYELDGDRVYAMVSKDSGRKRADARLETHDRYIDIQLVLALTDTMGWKSRSLCTKPCGPYDPETDMRYYDDEPDAWATTKSGAFTIFFPDDAHMPLIADGPLHKVVVKIAVVPGEPDARREVRP